MLQGGVSGGISPYFFITWALGEAGHFLHSIFKSIFAYSCCGLDFGTGVNPEEVH